ncbi:hypothetical protein DF141_29245 [Burkholderia cenocepacia]|nr:hypothetical protein DF141_29245 [Burkholderia cenocepacia]RQV57799.1 hypothetical protein DF024_26660 [Burkholderia cenocepacia]RQZ88288.1 hypothetical protein DF058_28220 [Burkholderia cenocepacia]RRA08197.1 hypothetical protein DF059_28660 [Burkholderia cenocepacia]
MAHAQRAARHERRAGQGSRGRERGEAVTWRRANARGWFCTTRRMTRNGSAAGPPSGVIGRERREACSTRRTKAARSRLRSSKRQCLPSGERCLYSTS